MSRLRTARAAAAGLCAGLLTVAATTTVHAQRDAFVAGVRELAEAAGTEGSTAGMETAVERLASALSAWDRELAAFEGRAVGELSAAAPPRAFQLRLDLGLRLLERGRLTEALSHLDALGSLGPPRSDIELLKAFTLEAAGRHADAAGSFRTAWTQDPTDPVNAYYVLDRPGAAAPADLERARATLAQAYQSLLDGTRAPSAPFATVGLIPDALSQAPVVGAEAWAEGFSLLASRRYDEAIAALRKAVRSGTPDSEHSPRRRFARGSDYEKAGRIAEARQEYRAALTGTLAGRTPLYVGLGRLAQVDGDLEGAIDAFSQAVRLAPNDPLVRKELAAAYAAAGRTDDAFRELVAALLINPGDAHAHVAIGRMYIDAGRDADAVPALTRALALMPGAYEPRYALATALARLGRTAEAARQLEMYERGRRETLERRRQGIADERQQLEGTAQGRGAQDGAR